MFRIYNVRELRAMLQWKRAQIFAVFAAGACFGLWLAGQHSLLPVADANAVSLGTPLLPAGTCDSRTTLRLDCSLGGSR